eukprot:826770-Pelagomonas_calceolata.AAC.6
MERCVACMKRGASATLLWALGKLVTCVWRGDTSAWRWGICHFSAGPGKAWYVCMEREERQQKSMPAKSLCALRKGNKGRRVYREVVFVHEEEGVCFCVTWASLVRVLMKRDRKCVEGSRECICLHIRCIHTLAYATAYAAAAAAAYAAAESGGGGDARTAEPLIHIAHKLLASPT